MKEYLLLLPIIFIFHDMEEVVGFGWFFRRNPDLFKRFPRITKAYIGFTDMGFAAAVYEEFIPFFGISLLAYYFPGKILYALWFGLFLSLTAHFIVHIGQTIYLRKYIPSFITSIICLPISVIILLKASKYITFDVTAIMIIITSILLMMANLRLAHAIGRRINTTINHDQQFNPS